jgi:hypothetical protein
VLLLAYPVVAQKVNKKNVNNAGDKPRAMRGRAGSTGNDLDAPAHMDPKVRRAGPLIWVLYCTRVGACHTENTGIK